MAKWILFFLSKRPYSAQLRNWFLKKKLKCYFIQQDGRREERAQSPLDSPRLHSTPAVTTNNVTGARKCHRTVIYFLKNKTNLSLSFGREVGKEGVSTGGSQNLLTTHLRAGRKDEQNPIYLTPSSSKTPSTQPSPWTDKRMDVTVTKETDTPRTKTKARPEWSEISNMGSSPHGNCGVGKGAVLLLLQRERGHRDTQIKEIKKQNKTRNPKTWKRRHSKLYRYTIHC